MRRLLDQAYVEKLDQFRGLLTPESIKELSSMLPADEVANLQQILSDLERLDAQPSTSGSSGSLVAPSSSQLSDLNRIRLEQERQLGMEVPGDFRRCVPLQVVLLLGLPLLHAPSEWILMLSPAGTYVACLVRWMMANSSKRSAYSATIWSRSKGELSNWVASFALHSKDS